jgi:citrate synthase
MDSPNNTDGPEDASALAQPLSAWLSAEQACERLGVKRATLYAYVSRGKLRARGDEDGRRRRYMRADVERLAARRDARSGHGAVAAGALRWGEPVLDSAITRIADDGPWYRGRSALVLARQGIGYESVAEGLWGSWSEPATWPAPRLPASLTALARKMPATCRPIDMMAVALPILGVGDPRRHHADREPTLAVARDTVRQLVAVVALVRRVDSRTVLAAPSTSEALAIALTGARPRNVPALDAALVLSADHELNPSSFAARVAASAGADLYACLAAALATLSGPRHGGVPERVEALVEEIGRPERAAEVVERRLRRGDAIPGFGHPLYPGGDPRAAAMLELAQRVGGRRRALANVQALVGAMRLAGAQPPNYDVGIYAVAAAFGLGAAEATTIFAVGRCAGWVAHVLEQREAGFLLRPRARYVGP